MKNFKLKSGDWSLDPLWIISKNPKDPDTSISYLRKGILEWSRIQKILLKNIDIAKKEITRRKEKQGL